VVQPEKTDAAQAAQALRRRYAGPAMTRTTSAPPEALLTPDQIKERVARLPRVPFATVPTPLEDLPKLTAALGGPRILVKREDLTGFAFGGNKVRALEFRMADVLARGCDTLVLVNIGQSNHARLHSAACVRLGLHMVIVKPSPADEEATGNLLLDRMLGVEIVEAHGRDSETVLEETLERLRAEGRTPYASTREPFSPLAGTVAFTEASIELRDQLHAASIDPRRVHLFLVGGTSAAGFALGGKLLGAGWRVHAVSVDRSASSIMKAELDLAARTAALLELPATLVAEDISVHDRYVGSGYADVTPGTLEAITLAARTDALFLDPVYTGKALSGLIGEVRNGALSGALSKEEVCVFVHTGGLPIIFAYHDVLAKYAATARDMRLP
jgi:1-aminocyclopropane-1-carboxylate deaminase/D-cysteine desulfhydrase-like pyridoxal-dependent ACC family enzyme